MRIICFLSILTVLSSCDKRVIERNSTLNGRRVGERVAQHSSLILIPGLTPRVGYLNWGWIDRPGFISSFGHKVVRSISDQNGNLLNGITNTNNIGPLSSQDLWGTRLKGLACVPIDFSNGGQSTDHPSRIFVSAGEANYGHIIYSAPFNPLSSYNIDQEYVFNPAWASVDDGYRLFDIESTDGNMIYGVMIDVIYPLLNSKLVEINLSTNTITLLHNFFTYKALSLDVNGDKINIVTDKNDVGNFGEMFTYNLSTGLMSSTPLIITGNPTISFGYGSGNTAFLSNNHFGGRNRYNHATINGQSTTYVDDFGNANGPKVTYGSPASQVIRDFEFNTTTGVVTVVNESPYYYMILTDTADPFN